MPIYPLYTLLWLFNTTLGALAWEAIADLKEMHEEWAGGMKLRPTSAYGVRLYQNGSSLVMHNDRVCASTTSILLSL